MTERLRLSHSALDTLSRCGVKYEYRHVLHLKRPATVPLLVGRAADAAISENLKHIATLGEPMQLDEVVASAERSLDAEFASGEVALSDEEVAAGHARARVAARSKASAAAAAHWEHVAPRLRPLHVQRAFEIEVGGEDIDLVGRIDVEEIDGSVDDTKTTGRMPRADAAHDSEQLTLYALATGVLRGEPEARRRVALSHIVFRGVKAVPLPPMESERGPDDYDRVLRRVEAAARVVRAGAFFPAKPGDWWCSEKWCEYWSVCPFARRPVSVVLATQGPGGERTIPVPVETSPQGDRHHGEAQEG